MDGSNMTSSEIKSITPKLKRYLNDETKLKSNNISIHCYHDQIINSNKDDLC